MPSVYDADNFAGRVNLAALYISEGRESSRSFDTCFEMDDGEAVGLALYRRAQKSPDSALARNLSRYLRPEHLEANAARNAHRTNLAAWARELRARATEAQKARWAEYEAKREAQRQAAPYREELTPAGPQLVIPGCERVPIDAGKPAQLNLFA